MSQTSVTAKYAPQSDACAMNRTGERESRDPRNALYQGDMEDGKYHGAGTLFHSNGNVKYEGEFLDGRYHGTGSEYNASGELLYEGEFANGERHGMGTSYNHERTRECLSRPVMYTGRFKDGHKQGKGTETEPNGDVYEGWFSKGRIKGKGKKTYTYGVLYEGSWDTFVKHGDGKMTFIRVDEDRDPEHTGMTFEGQWENGTPIGTMQVTYPAGQSGPATISAEELETLVVEREKANAAANLAPKYISLEIYMRRAFAPRKPRKRAKKSKRSKKAGAPSFSAPASKRHCSR